MAIVASGAPGHAGLTSVASRWDRVLVWTALLLLAARLEQAARNRCLCLKTLVCLVKRSDGLVAGGAASVGLCPLCPPEASFITARDQEELLRGLSFSLFWSASSPGLRV